MGSGWPQQGVLCYFVYDKLIIMALEEGPIFVLLSHRQFLHMEELPDTLQEVTWLPLKLYGEGYSSISNSIWTSILIGK